MDAAEHPPRRPEEMDEDAAPESEEEGEDLMKESGNLVGSDADSSEEEDEEDEEEQRRVAEGFIVDEDEEGGAEPHRKRKRRHAHARRAHEAADEELDEDDLALLSENTRPQDKNKAKRLRAAQAAGDERAGDELAHIFDDDEGADEGLPSAAAAIRRANADREADAGYDDDLLDDFIEEDEEEEQYQGLDEEQREALRREKLEERRRARQSGRRVDPAKVGIDPEAWEEIHDIFGNGEDYAWALEVDEEAEEEREGRLEYKDIFEPAQIQERMLTDEDERIRQVDLPERLQLALPGEEGLALLERRLSDGELDEAARWAAPRISPRCTAEFLEEGAPHARLHAEWLLCVRQMLVYLVNEHLEVPFLTQHRLDELEHTTFNEALRRTDTATLLLRQELLTLSQLGIKYKLLLARKDALRRTWERLTQALGNSAEPALGETAAYFDELLAQAGSVEEVGDLAEWLAMRFGDRYRDATVLAAGAEPDDGVPEVA